MLNLAEQVDAELPLPGEGAEPGAKHSTGLQAAAQGPAQLSSCSRTAPGHHQHPTGDRPFLYFPKATQAAKKKLFSFAASLFITRATSFSDSKESLRAVWGSNINTL